IASNTFAISSVGRFLRDYNVTDDTEPEWAPRGDPGGRFCRNQRSQGLRAGPRPGNGRGPQEPPYVPTAVVSGSAGGTFSRRNCLSYTPSAAPGREYGGPARRGLWL